MIDPVSLRLFVAVADRGSIAAAARAERITASAISVRISQLERQLDATLLVRRSWGIEPTIAGEELLPLARAALLQLDGIPEAFKRGASARGGKVRVMASRLGLSGDFAAGVFEFTRAHPTVLVEIEEAPASTIAAGVGEYAADLGVLDDKLVRPGLQALPFSWEQVVLAVPSGHPLAGTEQLPFAFAAEFDRIYTDIEEEIGMDVGDKQARPRHSSSTAAALRLVRNKLGVALVSARDADAAAKDGGLTSVRLTDPWAHRSLVLATRPQFHCSRSVTRLARFLNDYACRPTAQEQIAPTVVPLRLIPVHEPIGGK